MKFKTNIKCDGCVATVTPVLDEQVGKGKWSVDLDNPLHILSISGEEVTEESIKSGLAKVGYKADVIES